MDLCPVLRADEVTIPLRIVIGVGDLYALKLALVVMDVPLDGSVVELLGHRALIAINGVCLGNEFTNEIIALIRQEHQLSIPTVPGESGLKMTWRGTSSSVL